MDSERITSLIGIPPRRLSELEAAERKLQAVREVVARLRAPWIESDQSLTYRDGELDAADAITRALETP